MKIRTRLCISRDGYVTTPDGRPAQLADPGFSPDSYGFTEFQQTLDAVLMGRVTFEPALGAERWPWPGLGVYVLGSHRPEGTPPEVVVEGDPQRLLDRVRQASRGGDVHLVGGPTAIQTFHDLGAIDQLGVIEVPVEVGEGLRLPDALSGQTEVVDPR